MLEREIKIFLSGVKYGRERRMAMDAGEHWITVNGGSKKDGEGGGSHVKVDGEGRVVAGMGGKYKGTKLEDLPRKHFINEAAYQKRQAGAAAAGATAASGLYHKGKDGSEFYRYAGSPEGTAWRRKIDDAMNDPKYPAEREDYDAARREADQRAQEAQRKAEQAAASAQQSAQQQSPPETAQPTPPKLNMHPSLKRNTDGSLSAKFAEYPGREVINRLKDHGFKYDGETKTWILSKRRATDKTLAEVNKTLHDLKPVRSMSFAERSPYESNRSIWLHGGRPQAVETATEIGLGTIPNQNKALELTKFSDGSTRMTIDFGGYPGREVIDKLKAKGFDYDGDTRTWEARATDSTKVSAVNDILNGHFGGGSGASKVAPQVMTKLTSAGVTESSSRPGHFYVPRESYGHYEDKDKAFNDLFGLKISRHGSGRVSGAELDGQKISNSQATHLLSQSSFANFNAATGKWEGLDPELQKVWDKRHGGHEAALKTRIEKWVKEDRGEASPVSATSTSTTGSKSAPKTRAKFTDPISKQAKIDPEATDWIPAEAVPSRTIPGEGEFSPATYIKGKSAGEVWYEKDPAAYKAQGKQLQEGLRAMQPALDRLSGLVAHLPAGPRKSAIKNMMLAAEGRPGAENAPIQPKSLNSVEGLYRRFANARNALTTAARNADIQTLLDRPVAVQAPEHADPSGVTNIKIDLPPHLSSADLRRIEEFGFSRDPVSGGYRRKVSGGEADYQQVRADIDRMKGRLKYQTGSLMQGEKLPDAPRPAGG